MQAEPPPKESINEETPYIPKTHVQQQKNTKTKNAPEPIFGCPRRDAKKRMPRRDPGHQLQCRPLLYGSLNGSCTSLGLRAQGSFMLRFRAPILRWEGLGIRVWGSIYGFQDMRARDWDLQNSGVGCAGIPILSPTSAFLKKPNFHACPLAGFGCFVFPCRKFGNTRWQPGTKLVRWPWL